MEELISIVIPVYNVEDYIKECVSSVIGQIYRNIEIILVDDGSTDKSGEICEEFKKQDKRIIVIHKENGGLSDARNVGLKNAKGKYITFIDSDDYVRKDFIKILYDSIRNKADMAIANYVFVDNYGKNIENNFSDSTKKIFSNTECLEKIYKGESHGLEFLAWGKLYKKSIFDNNSIIYPRGRIHEDTFTTYKLVYFSKEIIFVNENLYFYRQRNGSIMNSMFKIDNIVKIEAIEEAINFYKERKEKYLSYLAANEYMINSIFIYNNILKNINDESRKKLLNNLIIHGKNIFNDYIRKSEINKIKKLLYFFYLYSIPVFRNWIIKIYLFLKNKRKDGKS